MHKIIQALALITFSASAAMAQEIEDRFKILGLTLHMPIKEVHEALPEKWQNIAPRSKVMQLLASGRFKDVARPSAQGLDALRSEINWDDTYLYIEEYKGANERLRLTYRGDGVLIGVYLRLPRLGDDQIIPLFEKYFDRYGIPDDFSKALYSEIIFGDKRLRSRLETSQTNQRYDITLAYGADCEEPYRRYVAIDKNQPDPDDLPQGANEKASEYSQRQLKMITDHKNQLSSGWSEFRECMLASGRAWGGDVPADRLVERLSDAMPVSGDMFWTCQPGLDRKAFRAWLNDPKGTGIGHQVDSVIEGWLDLEDEAPPRCVLVADRSEIWMADFNLKAVEAAAGSQGVERNEIDF